MPLYEHVFLTRQDATAAQVDELTEHFKTLIAGLGGKVTKHEYWGIKSLTFRIRKNRKAHYSFFNIDTPPVAIAEMERQMSINEDIIRYMTIRVEELEEGPSAMLRRTRDRDDDRGGFGDRGFGFGGGGGRDRDRDRGGGGGRPKRFEEPVAVTESAS